MRETVLWGFECSGLQEERMPDPVSLDQRTKALINRVTLVKAKEPITRTSPFADTPLTTCLPPGRLRWAWTPAFLYIYFENKRASGV